MSATAISGKHSLQNKFKDLAIINNHALVLSAHKGVSTKVFYDFADAVNIPEKTLASIINLSARTISNYKEKGKNLEPAYSEHLLKLVALYKKGEAVFGNIDEFNYWLKKPFWNSDQKPVDWLATPGGVDLVMEEVDMLAHGYPV